MIHDIIMDQHPIIYFLFQFVMQETPLLCEHLSCVLKQTISVYINGVHIHVYITVNSFLIARTLFSLIFANLNAREFKILAKYLGI